MFFETLVFYQHHLPRKKKLKDLLVVWQIRSKKTSISVALPFLCDSELLVLSAIYCHSQTSSLPAATYVLPDYHLSSATHLPLPLPTTTSHCLPLPTCNYLPHPATTYQILPPSLLATTCFFLPLSTCHYLPQSDTTSTCHYLPLPATACHYLLLPDYQLLPLLAIICHNLSAGPVAEIATTETIQQARMPNNLNRFLLENSFRQRISSSWFVF